MFGAVSRWLERRRALKQLCHDDARELLRLNPATAYYDAHQLATRARFGGDGDGFIAVAN